MNFNREIIHNLEGQRLNKTLNEVKTVAGKIIDDLTPGTTKDITKGLAAEDAMGRAAFSILKKSSQSELSQRINNINKILKFDENSYGRDREIIKACSVDGIIDDTFVAIAEEFTKLGQSKPEKLSFCWESRIPDLINHTKNTDGSVNVEVYEAIKELFAHEKISTRGIDDIIKGVTEWHRKPDGSLEQKFNKEAFSKFKEFMDINGKSMHEQDDVFTLYLGRTFNACTKQDGWLRKGEDYVFDHVAFNFAKRMYQQGEDILHMEYFLNNFKKHIEEGNRSVMSGFRFEPKKEEYWSKRLVETLKKDMSDEIIETCKVDGKDSLHNLLVVDALKTNTDKYYYEIKSTIEKLKDKDGYIPTDLASYLCRKNKPGQYINAHDLLKCQMDNGAINGICWRKICDGKISSNDIELCKTNGELKYENLDILETLTEKIRTNPKYQSYHIREVFEQLKNEEGIVDKTLLKPLDELLDLTHLGPKELKDCIKANGEVDRTLLELKKECIKKHSTFNTTFTDICKNADGSASPQGVEITRLMLDAKLPNDQKLVNTFKTKDGYDYEAIKRFIEEYKQTDTNYREKILNMSLVGDLRADKEVRKYDLEKFFALKDAMSKPEIAPLMKNHSNAMIINAKFKPIKYNGHDKDTLKLYQLRHLKPNDIETLERNGYPARFYHSLGAEKKFFVETLPESIKNFENNFIKGSNFEKQLEKITINDSLSLSYSTKQLGDDIQKVLEKLPPEDVATLKQVFRLEFGAKGLEGFPQRFELETNAPKELENAFKTINEAINRFYSTSVKSDNTEYSILCDEIIKGMPEFKMLIGKTGQNGERYDIKVLEQLQKLTTSNEYRALPEEDKAVAKLSVLLNEIGKVDSKPQTIKKQFMTDNDGIAVYIDGEWGKNAEYTSAILERFNISDQAKYRTTQLINDIGWSKKLENGELTSLDIAVNQRYKGDEKLSPLLEKIITGECKYNKTAVSEQAKRIRENQQVLYTPTMKELEPYIETTEINGEKLRYIDLNRPELKDKPILAHFLGYDGLDYTLDILRNKAYRSAFSASLIKGGAEGNCFAGRNTGIALEFDNVNIANISHTNIDSGFGKLYNHLKESLTTTSSKDIKTIMKNELNLTNEEYGMLMDKIIHTASEKEIIDCTVNGKTLSREKIIEAYKKGIDEILQTKDQNETTVLNARPFASIGIGKSIDAFEVREAVEMAQANDMVMLFKKRN